MLTKSLHLSAVLFISSLLSPVAGALPGDNCKWEQVLWGRWAFNRMFTMADGCIVQVTPIDKPGLIYREYVFDEGGRMLVFNSVTGDDETSTSWRSFFLLPVKGVPVMELKNELMTVTMANGSQVSFSKDSPYIVSTSAGFAITETPEIDMAPGGHMEIRKHPGVLLDAGWALGGRAYRDWDAKSTFRRPGSPDCTVPNPTIFAYIDPTTRQAFPQPILKYQDEASLNEFLEFNCSGWNRSH